ncbi:MAG: ankyrin repeat domain-containing protein [Pseudomonadota bacterium]
MTVYHDELFEVAARDDPERLLPLIPAIDRISEIRNRDGTTLLLHCLYCGARRNIEQLVAQFPDLSLHEAAALGQQDQIEVLADRDPLCINLLSGDGWTALHLAAFFGHEAAVRTLLAQDADPHLLSRSFEVNIPLQAACAAGALAAASLLVDATTAIDETGPGGTTALMSAAHAGMEEIVDALLEKGADPSRKNKEGKTASDYAVEARHKAIALRLASKS